MPIAVGQQVVCAPYGIGRVARTLGAAVEGIPTPCFAVVVEVAGLLVQQSDGGKFSLRDIPRGFETIVPMDRAGRLLRPLAEPAAATAALDGLRPARAPLAPAMSFAERLHRIDHVLRGGDLAACAALLAESLPAMLASDSALPFGEKKALHAVERLVVGEIALVLERPADALLQEIRSRFAPPDG